MLKAKITNISSVDPSGYFDVDYDVLDKGNKVYNFAIRVQTKQEAEEVIKLKLEQLIKAIDETNSLKVGDEITI